uniref:Uncharacterized protein n=1 Tax=Arundo donax TaxID=35708 RepID=A0A0A9HTU2_ARUDO
MILMVNGNQQMSLANSQP